MNRAIIVGVALMTAAASSCTGSTRKPAAPTIAISPASVQVFTGTSQQFTGILTGVADTTVTWSISEGSAGGTISSAGDYSAPATAGLFHITATSVSDGKLVATATANVVAAPPPVSLTISPASLTLNPGAMQQFSIAATGTTTNAVWWTVNEPNGGVINSNGVYTAPMTPGTYHVVATSVVGNAAPVMVAVTVAGAGGITVQASPATALLAAGATQQFSASVAGATDGSVVWSVLEGAGGTISSDGLYTPPATSGIYHVIATSNANPGSFAQVAVSVLAPAGMSLSGNVAYTGSAKGRIYVVVQGGGGAPGTSIAEPGAFAIRGIGNGMLTVFAFMDTVGTGSYLPTADPAGTEQVTVNNASASTSLTLVDPAPATPPVPSAVAVHPGADSVALTWALATDAKGNEQADHFRMHWGEATGSKCPASLESSSMVADAEPQFLAFMVGGNIGFVPGLVPGSSYCFAVGAVAGGVEGPRSAVVGPVTVRAPSAGSTLTGVVSTPASTPSSALYVIFSDASNDGTLFYDRIANPAANQAFTVTGVPNGKYHMPVFLDLDGNGHPDATDPSNFSFSTSAAGPVAVNVAGDMAGQNVGLQPWSSLAIMGTSYAPNGNYGQAGSENEPFVNSVVAAISGNLKLPVAVSVLAGPGVDSPFDFGASLSFGKGGAFGAGIGGSSPATPAVGQTFVVQVTYDDGTTEVVNPSVTGVLSELALPVEPVGTIVTTSPDFVWSAAPSMPPGFTYCVEISPWNSGPIWTQVGIASDSLTVHFNENGLATAPILNGGTYTWGVGVVDPYGNTALDYGMPLTVQQ